MFAPLRCLAALLCLVLLPASGAPTGHAGPLVSVIPRAALAGPAQGQDVAGLDDLPLGWNTYLGGSGNDSGAGIAVDSQGNVYVTGSTSSPNFPVTPGAAQPHFSGGSKTFDSDAFVAAYTPNGRLRWATYLGGKGDDNGYGIAVDGQGNVYVTGSTSSPNFPVTSGAAQSHFAGGDVLNSDAFVAVYTANGRLRWATYLGGTDDDFGTAIAVDRQGNAFITGITGSGDLPGTADGAQSTPRGGPDDAFVAAYAVGGQLRWATYLGGEGEDDGDGIAVDGQDNVYVTGQAHSGGFPVTANAAQPHFAGTDQDAFVAAYTGAGRVRWVTYLGGTSPDLGDAVTVDEQGNIYVAGYTDSPDFPVSAGAAQPHYGVPGDNGFVASYSANGRRHWATYLGESSSSRVRGIAVDEQGYVYVSGDTFINGNLRFPATANATQANYGGGITDAFVAVYAVDGRFDWATYLGGSDDDAGVGIAVDAKSNVYVVGATTSVDFPVTPGAAQTVVGDAVYGTSDGFVTRLVVPSSGSPVLGPTGSSPNTRDSQYFPQTHHTLAGPFLAFWRRLGGIPTLGLPLSEPFVLAGRRIQVTERAVLVITGGKIQLLPLGSLLSAARPFASMAPVADTAGRRYFPGTNHTLSGPFLAYWQAHQGSELLGAPISEPEREGLGDGTGRTYLVQWFTNGRLELHPEIKDPRYQVEQGRVGYEYLHRLGLV